jgi:peptide/nickel transport system ATP-binding protein
MKYQIQIKSKKRVLVDISHFELLENRINFLFGESGIGKTMISRAIYGLLESDELDITINNRPYEEYIQKVEIGRIKNNSFFVFQEPSSHLNPLMRLSNQLSEGSLKGVKSEKEILKRLWQNTDDLMLKKLLQVYPKPYRPSGGEKQRILLVMAFKKIDRYIGSAQSADNPCFIFDEPTGSLDNYYRELFLRILFEKYKQKKFTVMLITHDYSMIGEIHRNHHSILDDISYKELTSTSKGLQQNSFSAQSYLSWIEKVTPSHVTVNKDHTELLFLMSGIDVFNRRLYISKDPEGREICPLQIHKREMVYLKAGSGVGKTTLAKIIMGLTPSKEFSLKILDTTLNENTSQKFWQRKIWAKKVGMVFQHADEALNLNSKVRDVFSGLPIPRKSGSQALLADLKLVFEDDLDAPFLDKKITFLSGGQKQRLNLLRTLILDTDLIILDEPLNGLDFQSIRKIMSILQEKQQEGKGLLLISHNEEIFEHIVPGQNVYYLHAKLAG